MKNQELKRLFDFVFSLRSAEGRRPYVRPLVLFVTVLSVIALAHSVSERVSDIASGEAKALSEAHLWAAQTIVNGMIFLGIYVLFFGRMAYLALPTALALGENAYSASWFIGGVNEYLLRYPSYTEWFGHPVTGFVNPQYGMMAVFMAVLVCLVITVLFARIFPGYRFARATAVVVMCSMAFTGWFFHQQTVQSLDIADQRERRVLLSALSADDFVRSCREAEVLCYEDPKAGSEITGMEVIDEQLAGPLLHFAGMDFERSVHTFSGMDLRDANTRFFVAAVTLQNGVARVGVSIVRPIERMDFERVRLSLQMFAAHFTWLLGGIFVANIHRPREKPKIAWPEWEYVPDPDGSAAAHIAGPFVGD